MGMVDRKEGALPPSSQYHQRQRPELVAVA